MFYETKMTTVAIWLNKESANNPSLWAIADTRISSRTETGNSIRSLDIFPKIFEMPIKVSVDATQYRFAQVHSVGLAFAGSTLLASAAKDILSYLFGRLSLSQSYDFGTPIDMQKAISFSILKRAFKILCQPNWLEFNYIIEPAFKVNR